MICEFFKTFVNRNAKLLLCGKGSFRKASFINILSAVIKNDA